MKNRFWRLDARPQGNDFAAALSLNEDEVGNLADGEILTRNLYLSMDAGTRMWMTDRTDGYQPPLDLGTAMSGLVLGEIIASKADGFAKGDLVRAFGSWSDYSQIDAVMSGAMLLDKDVDDLRDHLGPLGMNGWTALWGIETTGAAKAGENVLVSAAGGSTGLLACQIAQILGAKTFGIAGGPEKCALLQSEYRLSGCFDYRAGGLSEKLADIEGGIDVYFDNVGGPIFEDVLDNMAMYGRVAVCGLVAEYTAGERRGPANFDQLLMKRLRFEGFFSPDFMNYGPELTRRLHGWLDEGKLKLPYDVTPGLENTLNAYTKLFTGANVGKVLVELET